MIPPFWNTESTFFESLLSVVTNRGRDVCLLRICCVSLFFPPLPHFLFPPVPPFPNHSHARDEALLNIDCMLHVAFVSPSPFGRFPHV
jgi:hypothetical protein